ncbi:hypothetical protein HC776_01455 [bacterium]|nr:hypothetical protein [bacterium]
MHYRFVGEWTWEEYYTALAQGRTMEKAAAHSVCTLNDMRQTEYLPADFIEQARSVSLTRPASTAIAVYISGDYHFSSIYEVIANLYPDTRSLYPLVRSEDEALGLIRAWFRTYGTSDSHDP